MNKNKHYIILSLVLLFCILIIISVICSLPKNPGPEMKKTELQNIEIKAYEAFMERDKLLISLSTAIIGAIGLLLMGKKKGETIGIIQQSFLLICSISAGLSIYLGYVIYSRVTELLSNSIFNLNNSYLVIPISGQFWAFFISVIFFTLFIFFDKIIKD